jgi:hypothetical protein
MTDADLEAAVAELCPAGFRARFSRDGAQQYVIVEDLGIPTPPWDQAQATIAVAIPVAFPPAALERFYLALPCTRSGSKHPNCNETVRLVGREWYPVGWHYPDGRPWRWGVDNLESHIRHCHAFFLGRVAREHR